MEMEPVFTTLLVMHVLGGSLALLAGYGAMLVKRGGPRHRTLGKVYVAGMLAVVLTGFPMSIIHPSPFLFGIVIFSGYFVYSGWSAAVYRKGEALELERFAAIALGAASAIALAALIYSLAADVAIPSAYRITGFVFAGIGLATAIRDLARLRGGPLVGKERIIKHLISMCAALIATTTAVAVTVLGEFPVIPDVALWLGPTIVLTPVIFYWVAQVRAGTFKY